VQNDVSGVWLYFHWLIRGIVTGSLLSRNPASVGGLWIFRRCDSHHGRADMPWIRPAHSSDQLQPCDLGIFAAMKTNPFRIRQPAGLSRQSKQIVKVLNALELHCFHQPSFLHLLRQAFMQDIRPNTDTWYAWSIRRQLVVSGRSKAKGKTKRSVSTEINPDSGSELLTQLLLTSAIFSHWFLIFIHLTDRQLPHVNSLRSVWTDFSRTDGLFARLSLNCFLRTISQFTPEIW
jgi:hypothetical protein